MHIKNRLAALVYRTALTSACFWGLYLHTVKNGTVTFSGYAYYTLLSNAACFLYFLPLTVKNAVKLNKKGAAGITEFLPGLKGAVTMMITVTLLIYHALLTPRQFSMGEMIGMLTAANLLVHYVVPVMVILDWFFFDQKGRYQRLDPLRWMLVPLAYFIFVLIRAQSGRLFPTGSRYPYFFIDVDLLGWLGVSKWAAAISLFFGALGYGYYFIDRALAKRKDNKSRRNRPVSV